jgi:hypothetical protein
MVFRQGAFLPGLRQPTKGKDAMNKGHVITAAVMIAALLVYDKFVKGKI